MKEKTTKKTPARTISVLKEDIKAFVLLVEKPICKRRFSTQ